ncbi:hypothetical protein ACFRFH_12070 [Leifsonia sp. NPDC056824]|uniref:hypothetical protein n=1 Tax=Leifsonia sp. NPDC056824 TaxID=3345953 RepID=UPI00367E7A91
MSTRDYAAMFPHPWMWPLVDLGIIILNMLARAARRQAARRDARFGVHVNHTVCRHGRAVNVK